MADSLLDRKKGNYPSSQGVALAANIGNNMVGDRFHTKLSYLYFW